MRGPHLLTLHQTAEMLQVHYQTARDWILAGRIRASRTGRRWRVDLAEVRHFLQSTQYVPPAPASQGRPGLRPVRASAPAVDLVDFEIPTPREMRMQRRVR